MFVYKTKELKEILTENLPLDNLLTYEDESDSEDANTDLNNHFADYIHITAENGCDADNSIKDQPSAQADEFLNHEQLLWSLLDGKGRQKYLHERNK